MSSPIHFEVDADGVALLTIDVPGRPMNVFTPEFSRALADAAGEISRRADICGAVITSGKASGFMAGADLKDLVGFHGRGGSAAEAMEVVGPGGRALRALERCGKPVAAAINGLMPLRVGASVASAPCSSNNFIAGKSPALGARRNAVVPPGQ